MRLEVKQALEIRGGTTKSIFPQAEAWLEASSDRMHALTYVAARKNMERYRSVMDFLFCELFEQYKYGCFKFYRQEGPPLREILSVEQVLFFQEALLKGLEIAYSFFKEKRWQSWAKFRSEVLDAIAA